MSSMPETRPRLGAALVLLASLTALAWYGQRQLVHSLAFSYHLLRAIFPGLPAIEGPP